MRDYMQKMVLLARKYPLSVICFSAVWVLSFLPFSDMGDLEEVPFIDKWTHIAMYGGACCVLWTEYVRRHRTGLDGEELFFWAWLMPVVMSGIIELLQEFCTTYRGGEWLDLAANSTGITLPSATACCCIES